MLDDLDAMIQSTPFAADDRRRLKACVPPLVAVLAEVPASGSPLILAAATPMSAAIFGVSHFLPLPDWPVPDRASAVRDLPRAISAGDGEVVMRATAALLGREAVVDLALEWRDLTAQKQQPVVVVLFGPGSRVSSTLITITALPPRMLH
jgi:hypothetical protein